MNEIKSKSNFKKTILSIVAWTLLWAFASVSFVVDRLRLSMILVYEGDS